MMLRVPRRGTKAAAGARTIYDVAMAASVSIKTVSRVLNKEPNVRPETRARVTEAMTSLGFRPNIAARRLAGGRSFLLGLLVHDATPAYLGGLQLGALARCREDGFHMVIEPVSPGDAMAGEQIAALLTDLRLEGAILTPPVCDDVAILDTLEALALPYVRVAPGRDVERAARVEIDDRAAAADMTRLLLSLGHVDIGFVAGPAEHCAALRRADGFRDAMEDAGLPLHLQWMACGDFSFRSGVSAASSILNGPRRPSAIFASNDDMALGVMAQAQRLGIEMPAELSVAGFDDTPASELFSPCLTTVHQPILEMGRAAADLLISKKNLSANNYQAILFECCIVARNSVASIVRDI